MPSENENKLKLSGKDSCSVDGTKCDDQNISKYIDTDPYSYATDLIMQFSKNITKGKGLTKRGVNALFLFILTSGLLYNYTQFPKNLTGFLEIYIVPLIFLFYVFVDLLKNIPQINNFFMITFNKSDFVYCAIINGSICIHGLNYYLRKLPFNIDQLEEITKYLIKNEHFPPKSQSSLMRNNSLFTISSNHYLKELILDHNFASQSVCIYLRQTKSRLSHEYLDRIIKKYKDFPSVLFCVGFFHEYNGHASESDDGSKSNNDSKSIDNSENDRINFFLNLGYSLDVTSRYPKRTIIKLIKRSLIYVIVIIFISLLTYFLLKPILYVFPSLGSTQVETIISSDFLIPISCLSLIILAIILLFSINFSIWLSQNLVKYSIQNYLKKHYRDKKLTKDEFKCIIDDVSEAYR